MCGNNDGQDTKTATLERWPAVFFPGEWEPLPLVRFPSAGITRIRFNGSRAFSPNLSPVVPEPPNIC